MLFETVNRLHPPGNPPGGYRRFICKQWGNTMTKTLTLYSDPGHAWLKVPVTELSRVGLSFELDFSSCSYGRIDARGNMFVYLEEDCDMGIYLATLLSRGEPRPNIKDSYTNGYSRVRSFRPLKAGPRFEANMQWASNFFKERYANSAA
jgi:hypothetical protein